MEIRRIKIENFDDLEKAKEILPQEVYEEIVKKLKQEDIDVEKNKELEALDKALERFENIFQKVANSHVEEKSINKIRIVRKALNNIAMIFEKTYKEVKGNE